jgi:uncharacterized membrane protein YtjA (UPF0391 family)
MMGKAVIPIACPANRRLLMLSWSLAFLVVAILAGILGFSGIARTATGIAKLLFYLFLILFLLSLVSRLF